MSSENSGQDVNGSGKPGHFWELEAWMETADVSVRELAILLGRKKTAISRLVCGQFVRIEERLQADLKAVTHGAVAEDQWRAFTQRRLAERLAA